MSLLNRLASLTPAVPPGAALAGTVTIVSKGNCLGSSVSQLMSD
jgi:hypothetical protein